MRTDAPPPIDPQILDAIAASLRLWFCALAAYFIENFGALLPPAFKRALREDLRLAATDLRVLVFARAFARVTLPPVRAATKRPQTNRPGFRCTKARGDAFRRYTNGLFPSLNTGSLQQRAARLKRLLANLETHIARMMKRLARGLRDGTLVLAGPITEALICCAAAPKIAHADTS
jgi:hypothetical protein